MNIKYLVGGIALIAVAVACWWAFLRVPAPVGTFAPAPVAGAVRAVPTQIVQGKVRVYTKPAAGKLGIQIPDSSRVVAATTIHADPHPQTVVTSVNPETGATETGFKREPYPWLAAQQTGEVRLGYGYRGSERVARLSVTEYLVQVKGLNLGVEASLDQDGQHFAGVSVSYRW